MREQLVSLSKGTWVRRSDVRRIAAHPSEEIGKTTLPARVNVTFQDGQALSWNCDTLDEAVNLAARFAKIANEPQAALSGGGGSK